MKKKGVLSSTVEQTDAELELLLQQRIETCLHPEAILAQDSFPVLVETETTSREEDGPGTQDDGSVNTGASAEARASTTAGSATVPGQCRGVLPCELGEDGGSLRAVAPVREPDPGRKPPLRDGTDPCGSGEEAGGYCRASPVGIPKSYQPACATGNGEGEALPWQEEKGTVGLDSLPWSSFNSQCDEGGLDLRARDLSALNGSIDEQVECLRPLGDLPAVWIPLELGAAGSGSTPGESSTSNTCDDTAKGFGALSDVATPGLETTAEGQLLSLIHI